MEDSLGNRVIGPVLFFFSKVFFLHRVSLYSHFHIFIDERNSPQQLPGDLHFGDMQLNEKQKDALKKGKNMAGMTNSNSFAAVQGVNLRWTNGVIPYVIDCSLGKRV